MISADSPTRVYPQDLPEAHDTPVGARSLRELIERATGGSLRPSSDEGDAGFGEKLPFPFFAIVGQKEMKLALLVALINPAVGGVLLIGPRGTGKTTAVRSLTDLLPQTPRSLCYFGCMPEDVEIGGLDAVCPDCARKYGQGDPLAALGDVRLVELPLNARLEDVVGGIDERAAIHERMRLRRGILAQADRNLLYVDEVNLLENDIVDAILDASAQGSYTVRRGPVSATYRARFVMIGSMNPEEGNLRPQIMDRFGLRVIVQGLTTTDERLSAYQRVQTYLAHPRRLIKEYADMTAIARSEIQAARDLLPKVTIPQAVAAVGLELVQKMQIDSLRAEITLFEAARAFAAADNRTEVRRDDIEELAPMTLRLRRSPFMAEYFARQALEENELSEALQHHFRGGSA